MIHTNNKIIKLLSLPRQKKFQLSEITADFSSSFHTGELALVLRSVTGCVFMGWLAAQ